VKRNWKVVAILAALALMFTAVVGCGDQPPADEPVKEASLGYVEWDCAIASTYVVKNVLEEMGYEVTLNSLDAGIMWQGIGEGQFDGLVTAWLPHTHADYYAAVQDKVENLGANLEGARIGLVVPSYVTIDSIAEMNEHKDKFDGKIVGIEPGAGIMKATEKAIEGYGLDLELQDSSSFAMAAALKAAIDKEEWIAVTGWTPHWKFAKFDLKYLEDPDAYFGGEEHIATIVRQGLKEEKPEVHRLLDGFSWTAADIGAVMGLIEDGLSPDEAAKQWIAENRGLVDTWLP
jgi:glycine betaine/proline transport system substrate-binding protein